MIRKLTCYLIFSLFVVGLIACGDSDDQEREQTDKTTKPQTPPTAQNTPADEGIEGNRIEVNFAVEEAAVRELFESHAEATRKRDVALIMDYWILRKNDPEVFMTQCFGGLFNWIETLDGVKKSFEGDFAIGRGGMTVTIEAVGIDKRGKNGTLRGTYQWAPGAGNYVAAVEKDKEAAWKIRAIDFCDKGIIKEIKTPQ